MSSDTHMPRPRPPGLCRELTRHGRVVWYVRPEKGARTRLRAPYGTPEFEAEYKRAISGAESPQPAQGENKSLRWLVDRYRETQAWLDLSKATRRQRDNIFSRVFKTAGRDPYATITRADIIAGKDRRAETPAAARNFLDAMRGLFRWALEAQFRADDPTQGVKNPKRKKGPGFPIWTEDDADAYERRWPIGTRQRVWFNVLCYTGGRRGDAVKIGRQHVRDGIATFRTEKSGEEITVTIPILPVLARTLKAGPVGDLTFVVGARGHPLTKESFGNAFSEAARQAGVKKSAHGVRKIAATRAADNGATVAQLNAIFGWTGSAMASLYTQAADRRRLALEAAHKIENAERTSIPAPVGKVRERKSKAS